MPTTGLFNAMAPVDPSNLAFPNEKMPPSDATSQYPWLVLVPAMPTTGRLRWMAPVEP